MTEKARKVFLTAKDRKGNWAKHVEEVWPDVHDGNIQLQILMGPDSLYEKYALNNLRSRRLQITRSVYAPGGWTKQHVHPDHEHAYYVIRGHATVTVGAEERVLGPGDTAFIPMGVEHGYATHGGEPVELLDIHAYEDAGQTAPDAPARRTRRKSG